MDQPRYLARRAETGYTTHLSAAMRDEPEAVALEVQELQTATVHRTVAQTRLVALASTRDALQKQANWHNAQARACEREIRRLDRKLPS